MFSPIAVYSRIDTRHMHKGCTSCGTMEGSWLNLECLDVKSHIYHTALHSLSIILPHLLHHSSEPRDTENIALTIMSLSNPSTPLDQKSTTSSMEQARLLGILVFTWPLMLIIVSLRFVARSLSKAALWYDVWLRIPAAVRQVFGPLSLR